MARADGRIEPGQKLSTAISARAWNRAQQAADVVLGAGFGAVGDGQQSGSAPYTFVYAKNGTGSDLARWGIMSITGVEVTPTSDNAAAATKQFQSMPVVTGGTPSTSTTAWCVAVEPIATGKIGRVAVAGVVQCKISMGNSSHKFARAKGSTSEVESAWSGEALILWQSGGWALVRLGAPDLTKYESFDATKQQVLGHAANGSLKWLDTTACT